MDFRQFLLLLPLALDNLLSEEVDEYNQVKERGSAALVESMWTRVRILVVVARVHFFQKGILNDRLLSLIKALSQSFRLRPHPILKIRNMACF